MAAPLSQEQSTQNSIILKNIQRLIDNIDKIEVVQAAADISQTQKSVGRGRLCNARTVAAVTGYLLFISFMVSGLVLALLHGKSPFTTGLMVGGAGGIGLETLVLLVLKYKSKKAIDQTS